MERRGRGLQAIPKAGGSLTGRPTPGMARQLRVEYPGAVYHVMTRGDRREPIFMDKDDADRKRSQRTSALKYRLGAPGAASSSMRTRRTSSA